MVFSGTWLGAARSCACPRHPRAPWQRQQRGRPVHPLPKGPMSRQKNLQGDQCVGRRVRHDGVAQQPAALLCKGVEKSSRKGQRRDQSAPPVPLVVRNFCEVGRDHPSQTESGLKTSRRTLRPFVMQHTKTGPPRLPVTRTRQPFATTRACIPSRPRDAGETGGRQLAWKMGGPSCPHSAASLPQQRPNQTDVPARRSRSVRTDRLISCLNSAQMQTCLAFSCMSIPTSVRNT